MMVYSKMMRAFRLKFPEIIGHEFNKKLYNGKLHLEFEPFLNQDKYYLDGLSKVLKKTALRFSNLEHKQFLENFSEDIKDTQTHLHDRYLKPLPLSQYSSRFFQPRAVKMEAFVYEHLQYLDNLTQAPLPLNISGFLPCLVVYSEIGLDMHARGIAENHPYKRWIASYSSDRFLKVRMDMAAIAEELACTASKKHQEDMIEVFIKGVHFEMLYWDYASGENLRKDSQGFNTPLPSPLPQGDF